MSLRAIVQHIANARGIVLEKENPCDPPSLMRFRGPTLLANLDLDQLLLGRRCNAREAVVALLDREVTDVQRTLFRATTAHIAKHDREPLDRLRQIEAAGRALLDALGPSHTGRADNPLTKAALDLEQLLHDKPGAASWQRDGYGKDPA